MASFKPFTFCSIRGISFALALPFPPPAEGWLPQTVHLLNGMAFSDLINAIVALIFVYGYFARAKWHLWLGTLTLTIRRLFLPMGQ
jgi:hypothetical protein